MKRIDNFTVKSVEKLTSDIYKTLLSGDTSAVTAPGQFVNIAVDGFYLRRPISVCDVEGDELTVVYRTVGGGTERLSNYLPGDTVSVVSGLGNGFNTERNISSPLLIGGGVGVPPLVLLAKALYKKGLRPKALLGFRNASDVILTDELGKYCDVYVATEDGSFGHKGFVTGLLGEAGGDYIYACGPEPMLKAILSASELPAELSFESRMACGMGACLTCTCHTTSGARRICSDGPVFEREDIIWTQR
ncbi:MAG: dihydroorotate dehydrogenase electron transfer subunit [Clostridia bacterium]|nr:dihydroorotate dehydrogenase electron transfer subunit [Clostridia bacterium]